MARAGAAVQRDSTVEDIEALDTMPKTVGYRDVRAVHCGLLACVAVRAGRECSLF